MNSTDKSMIDSSGRFRTDKNFKNTILRNCSRLRQRSMEDNYQNRQSKIQQKINNIKRITNYKKISNFKDNNITSSPIKFNNSRDKNNISVESNLNFQERKTNKIIHSNIRKAFLMDLNNKARKEIEKDKDIDIKETSDSLIEKNKKTINKHNTINSIYEYNKNKLKNENKIYNNENNDKKSINENHENFINNSIIKDKARKTHRVKNNTNDGIKELVININEGSNSKSRIFTKRSNSIRRIMNSLYYNSYTTEKKEKSPVIRKTNDINNNNNIEIFHYKNRQTYNKNKNTFYKNNENNKENDNENDNENNNENINEIKEKEKEKNTLNTNSNCSYIYKKKNRKFGNIYNSNNFIFNTYSTEDNSFIINDTNFELAKKNLDNTQKLIKVKIVYRKPQKVVHKESEIENENNNAASVNQTVHRRAKRGRMLFEKRTEDNDNDTETEREYSKEKLKINNLLTPIIRNNNLMFSSKDISSKNSDINNLENSTNNISFENSNNSIIEFFDDIIELCNSIEERTIFDILTKNINKKYIIDYNKFILEKNINDNKDNFNYCFKYFCIILITFTFLSKDEILYKYNSVKIHLLFIQYIYSSLCYIGYQDLNSKNIKRFFNDYHFKKKVSIIQCTTSIIRLLFDDKEEYNSLNNVLKQLMVNARTTGLSDMTKIINQTILFCFNQKSKKQNPFPYFKQKSNAINNIYNNYLSSNNDEYNNTKEKSPVVPYIKTSMRKKFCLVLDLDETISHSLKLNFGYYFLLRPGVIEFLTELSEYYEIIIFTSSPKIYADSIIDKIDESGNLISHRLYKPHVIFERGKSVKKLNLIGRDLNKIIFVDNLKSNAKYNPKNLYLIPSWTDDIYDDELFKLKNKLKYIYTSGKFNDDITKGL